MKKKMYEIPDEFLIPIKDKIVPLLSLTPKSGKTLLQEAGLSITGGMFLKVSYALRLAMKLDPTITMEWKRVPDKQGKTHGIGKLTAMYFRKM